MARSLKLGAPGKAPGPIRYFNPLTGNYDAEIRYTQHLVLGRGACHWLPKGLTMANVKSGHTTGFQRKRAAPGVPGWVWVRLHPATALRRRIQASKSSPHAISQ